MRKSSFRFVWLTAVAAASMLATSGCSESKSADTDSPPPVDPGGGDPAPPVNETLADTLNALGVDTDETPRLDNRGDPYPDTYAPLGTIVAMRKFADASEPDGMRLEFGRTEELLLLGYRPDAQTGVLTVIDDLPSGTTTSTVPDTTGDDTTLSATLFAMKAAAAPWAVERNTGGNSSSGPRVVQGTRRDATAADLDGDGFRETAIVYYVEYVNGGGEVRLFVTDARAPAASEFDIGIPVDPALFPINDLRVTSGDFDGDQKEELAIAVSRVAQTGVPDTPVRVYLVDDASADYALLQEFDPQLDTTIDAPLITLVIKGARLDHDINTELVLVVNEEDTRRPMGAATFATRYLALEHETAGLAILSSGPIVAHIGSEDHVAVVADVAIGDLDDDSVDEMIFAGLEEIIGNCDTQNTSGGGLKHVLVGLGNRFNKFAQVGASASPYRNTNCDDANSTMLRFTHVNTLDFDGDGDLDIQVNNLVFDDFPTGSWSAAPLAELPAGVVISRDDPASWYDRSNSAMAVSDQTGDTVADIITLLLDFEEPTLQVWTCTLDPDTGRCVVSRFTTVALWPEDMNTSPGNNVDTSSHVNPILIPVDVDNDDVMLIKYRNEHILDFTEPLVLAALAAPPCESGIGQNVDSCSTTWGSATSASAERTFSVKISGSVSFGFGAAGAGGSVKAKHKLSIAASFEFSKSYELTSSLAFSTGPLEDSVIFQAVPLDRYSYETIASSDPADIGTTYSIDLPRDVITMIAERNFYNSNIQPDAPHVDDRVFGHVPGRVSSYPTAQQKDSILVERRSQLEGARQQFAAINFFDPVEAMPGLQVGPISVGQGTGATELALEYVEIQGNKNAIELAYEYESEAAYGALVGFSVGISGERSVSVSHGDSTTYSGVVGSIDSTNFADNRYQFGLFTYLQELDGRELEVVNYWVEIDP